MLEGLLSSEVVDRDMEKKRAEIKSTEVIQRSIEEIICMQQFLQVKLKPHESIYSFFNLISVAQ